MKPIQFSCEATIRLSPHEIADQILNISNWLDFKGYGPLPGIRAAQFEVKTPEIVGSRIRVTNTDGSSHVEEIVEWRPETRLQLNMQEFSKPLSRLATLIEEVWEFTPREGATQVTRTFRLHARSAATRLVLWAISFLLKRAIARHLREMAHHLLK